MTGNYVGAKCGRCTGLADAHHVKGPVIVQLPGGGVRTVPAHPFIFTGKAR